MRNRDQGDAPDLHPGACLWMSAPRRERHPKYGDRRRVIVSQGRPGSWRVKFDERRTLQAVHYDYPEPVPTSFGTDRGTANRASRRDDIAGHDRPDRK
jgi:hypothetical protein